MQTESRIRRNTREERLGAIAGILGPLFLAALVGWPFSGAAPDVLVAYARSHELLFFAGGWLQATGALLSCVFFLVLVHVSDASYRFDGLLVIVGAAVLLSIVLVEAALLEAVPIAASADDRATVATTFALSNGVFARIFPLAPAPMLFAGLASVVHRSSVIPSAYFTTASGIAILFVLAGVVAVFSPSGLILAIIMSIVEAVWILAAAISFARTAWK
jgi:hypothetical protein